MSNAIKEADRKLQKELNKQLSIIYPTAVIILWTEYGWRKKRILRRFKTSEAVWEECANFGERKSMMYMLEEETGIEIRMRGCETSYHDLAFLDADKWDGTLPTPAQAVYVKNRMLPWIAPQLLSCLCIVMHRDEKYGPQRIAEFIGKVDDYRMSNGNDPKYYLEEMERVTGITKTEIEGTRK